MQDSCQIPTPKDYVQLMLDKAGYQENLYGKTVLENSCGSGNILIEIVRRYIMDCRIHNFSDEKIKFGLERDIFAYEIDKEIIENCKNNLNELGREFGLVDVNWNIHNKDYLTTSVKPYDYIIGNPPYITYHNLLPKTREYLKNNFSTCSEGRFDYCYAFIEKSINSLKKKGVLVYLIPFSIFRNRFAQKVRDEIKSDLVSIYDYSGEKVFPGVTTSVAVIHIIKDSNQEYIEYFVQSSAKSEEIEKSRLKGKWFFSRKRMGLRFGDYFKIQNSVATLCNEAFLLTDYTENDNYYIVGRNKIEKQIVHEAVSVKSCKKKGIDRIIFPYKMIENGYEHFDEKELGKLYPGAVQYLKSYKEKLNKRKINDGVQWFEYGRTQALEEVYGNKLIMPMVITTKVTAYEAKPDAVPYAGYFIKTRQNSQYDLQFAKKLLESNQFYEYVKNVGTPTTTTSYRVSVKEIEDFTFIN